jgi:hypothetical protein
MDESLELMLEFIARCQPEVKDIRIYCSNTLSAALNDRKED